eukprot:364621-Chlamydomonas_euryale.AAC.5
MTAQAKNQKGDGRARTLSRKPKGGGHDRRSRKPTRVRWGLDRPHRKPGWTGWEDALTFDDVTHLSSAHFPGAPPVGPPSGGTAPAATSARAACTSVLRNTRQQDVMLHTKSSSWPPPSSCPDAHWVQRRRRRVWGGKGVTA